MAKAKTQRFTVVSDNDGHEFVIPVEKVTEFYEWLDDEERSTYNETDRYDEYLSDGGRLTFENPRTE